MVYDLFATADVFHYTTDASKFQGGLYAVYEVVKPATVILRINSGAAFWKCENTSTGKLCVFYTDGVWDLSKRGVFSLNMPITSWRSYTGARFQKGAYVVDSAAQQIYDARTGKHLKLFRQNKLARASRKRPYGAIGPDSWFTAADLRKYEIRIDEIASDWKSKGYVGVQLTLTDAAGETFDLPGAEVTAHVSSGGPHETIKVRLVPRGGMYEKGSVNYRYKFYGTYPEEFFEKQRITVIANVWVLGPDGRFCEEVVQRTITRQNSKPVAFSTWANLGRRKDLRTKNGKLRESRVLWCHGSYFKWWQSIEKADQAIMAMKMLNVNIFCGGIFFAGRSHVRTKEMVTLESIWEGPGVFEYFIKKAHEAGIEVHPSINCSYGGGGWGGPQLLKEHPEWAAVDRNNKPYTHSPKNNAPNISDLHRPEFRKHLIN